MRTRWHELGTGIYDGSDFQFIKGYIYALEYINILFWTVCHYLRSVSFCWLTSQSNFWHFSLVCQVYVVNNRRDNNECLTCSTLIMSIQLPNTSLTKQPTLYPFHHPSLWQWFLSLYCVNSNHNNCPKWLPIFSSLCKTLIIFLS